MSASFIPEGYAPHLSLYQTQSAISLIKRVFQDSLARALNLKRVSAPLFVEPSSGLNDDLNGVERPVSFDIPGANAEGQVVHSLAKWKRMALYRYDILPGKGIYTDMNAIRRDETPDNLHSIYVDQWDWEKSIRPEQRNLDFLRLTVRDIYAALRKVEADIYAAFPHITPVLPEDVTFIHAQDLLDRYPELSPREREREAARQYGAVFIIGIGAPLSDGVPHDLRAPDYDDWSSPNQEGHIGLNGDLIVWDRVLDCPMELSSMGIRVDAPALLRQLDMCACPERKSLSFHRMLLEGRLPLSIGGGIGQSRLCMFLLQKAHIGEVQASLWPEDHIAACAKAGIALL